MSLKERYIAATTAREFGRGRPGVDTGVIWDSEVPEPRFFDGEGFVDQQTDLQEKKERLLRRAIPIGKWEVVEGSERDL